MQYLHAGQADTWTEWEQDHWGEDDATKLAALREYITRTARAEVASGSITAEWANKKLPKLGITERVQANNSYVIEAPITGIMTMTVVAANRADALEEFTRRAGVARVATTTRPVMHGAPVFTFGPEDKVTEVDSDAPATVGDTLALFREIVMLANVAGPRFDCDSGANHLLAEYGLDPVPPRKQFVVTRPVQATMRTVVEAYDEASAERVAGWRWDNSRTGHTVAEATVTGDVSVDVN